MLKFYLITGVLICLWYTAAAVNKWQTPDLAPAGGSYGGGSYGGGGYYGRPYGGSYGFGK